MRESQINWISLAISGGALLRFVMNDFGYALDNGFVLIADDEAQARRFAREYSEKSWANANIIASWKKRRAYPENYGIGFLLTKKGICDEEMEDFLLEKDFFPIVISGGIFPDYLKEGRYLFRLREADLKEINTREYATEMHEFQKYVKENIQEICKILNNFASSIAIVEYVGEDALKSVYNFLMGVGTIYAAYLRTTQTEREVSIFFERFKCETLKRLSLIDEFASGEVLKEMISSLAWEFLYQNNEVVLANLDSISIADDNAIQEGKAIVYDKKYYYFPPGLFMEICASLLDTRSKTELKTRLKTEGILDCNSGDYTVKKTIITVAGKVSRPRFLRVLKESLLSPDNLYLEDIFYEESKEEI